MSLAELTEQREQAQSYPEVILVEGLFDYAALWEAGFQNVTCSLGTHLNRRQFRQLCDRPRTVYLTFDADSNGSGHARATTPRGTCTATGGLDAETFRGFQLAGELFLLTSFFMPRRRSLWVSDTFEWRSEARLTQPAKPGAG